MFHFRAIALFAFSLTLAGASEVIPAGPGSYLKGLPEWAKGPPVRPVVSHGILPPIPTNTWWSSLAWLPLSETMFPHPFSVKMTKDGVSLNYPGAHVVADESAIMGMGGFDLVVGHSKMAEFSEAKLAGWSDFFVKAKVGEEGKGMTLSFGHGSPFLFAEFEGGAPVVSFKRPPTLVFGDGNSAELVVKVGDRVYGLYAPAGSHWEGIGGVRLSADTNGKSYFTVAILPDERGETLALFRECAHVHVTGSQVQWNYDEKGGRVRTKFQVATSVKEGSCKDTLLALYPHQWRDAQAEFTGHAYGSVRGPMKVVRGTGFSTTAPMPSVLPGLPVTNNLDRGVLRKLLEEDLAAPFQENGDTYWQGKQVGKWAALIPMAEQLNEQEAVAEYILRIKKVLEGFFSAVDRDGKPKHNGLFAYEPNWGTLIGYPSSFGSDQELNDHHFHYGYFFHAAGEVARKDPAWVKKWMPMLRMLIRDVASADRTDSLFPFLRCFDPYAGHSWASGHGRFGDGNNQESSSESVNAWYGLLLLAEVLQERELRDQAAWMLATEVSAVEDYWFDVRGDLFPKSYPASVVTMVWGGKGANGTWFDGNPQAVHGINFLPVTGASLYLGRWPAYAEKNYKALLHELAEFRRKEKKTESPDAVFDKWADILWMQQATFDAEGALQNWRARGGNFKAEPGNSSFQTECWIGAFLDLGRLDRTVSADIPFAATFVKGLKRSHVAWNLSGSARTVTFSDGARVRCEGGRLGVN